MEGLTSPPHPRQILSAHFIYFPARDLFNGFLTRPSERLRDAPLSILMFLLLFKRSGVCTMYAHRMHIVNTGRDKVEKCRKVIDSPLARAILCRAKSLAKRRNTCPLLSEARSLAKSGVLV